MRALSGRRLERAREMKGADAGAGRDVVEAQRPAAILGDEFEDAHQDDGGQTAARLRRAEAAFGQSRGEIGDERLAGLAGRDSFRGFVPLVLGKALADNAEGGELWFIDPSLVDDFWKDPEAVQRHFSERGVKNIRHFLMTTQQFAVSESYRLLGEVGLVFIDGYHSEEQARFDYATFENHLSPEGIILLHDSAVVRTSRMYGDDRAYEHRVKCFVDELKKDARLQVFDLPFGRGVTMVRKSGA